MKKRPGSRTYNSASNEVRVIKMQEKPDTTKYTLLFIHGSPGAAMNFKKYLIDADLLKNFNMIAYDRIGYGAGKKVSVLNDLNKESDLVKLIARDIPLTKLVLVGYSYGGTIAAAYPENISGKILLAPAVKADCEPMYWALNLYRWNFTRPMIPHMFANASMEKLGHLKELPLFEDKWGLSAAAVLSIHGNKDRIVPYENSVFLQEKLGSKKFMLITLDGEGHALVWTKFDQIKEEILKIIKKTNA
ncbi:MAG: alpha/beta hydrolase [Flavobacteriaceae bacterium]|nr:alpha/beta hydrolase [Flavobacteriaceae bacterium]